MASFRTRFAPSPTGRLHLGHVFSAFLVRRAADEAGGEALLRIEDIDRQRCRKVFEDGIFEDLEWLGLRWDGEVRRQSDHVPAYQAVVHELTCRGLAYRCFKTRRELAKVSPADGSHPLRGAALPPDLEAERLDAGTPYAWRLSIPRALESVSDRPNWRRFAIETAGKTEWFEASPEGFDDVALTRKDAPAAYHLAACHDDAEQGMTHIIRGEDLIDAPHIHVLLQALMGWPTPVYRHHRLLTGRDGKKFAKRDRSVSIADLRRAGYSASDVRRMADAH